MIQLRNVSVTKSGRPLFENFSWEVGADHWVIAGANGSGKTLLLELLAGVTHASHGKVSFDLIKSTTWDERYSERKRKIHYVPAHAIQTFLRSQEVFYQQRYYSIGDERTPRVKDLFGEDIQHLHALDFPESFNIDALLDLEVTRLSNGQLKKVLILKNLVQERPELMLFDYPFEGLDHTSRADFVTFIDHLAKTYGIRIILVDHEHHLPSVIRRKIVLDNFRIASIEEVQHASEEPSMKAVLPGERRNGTPVVEMKDVSIRYGAKEIIHRLHWSIHKGERWALTGKNGSGKTTLFSLIFADHPMAYSQPVYLFGKRRGSGESIWDIKNRINYLGPELINYLNPKNISQTAREYILTLHKDVDLTTLREALHYFDIETFIDRPVKYLSSGQLQLMLIIGSLLSDKELLLLDEPFQFLDPLNKQRVSRYIQAHLHPETTLVLITHYERDMLHWTEQRMHL